MVIARYANRQPLVTEREPVRTKDLAWKAVRVGSFWAVCAFAFLTISERNLIERVQALNPDPQPQSIEGGRMTRTTQLLDAKAFSPAVAAAAAAKPSIPLPSPDKNTKVTEFSLGVSPEFRDLNGVKLRLTGLNAGAHTYDIRVRTKAREFYRQDVKLDEHVSLAKDFGTGAELVVAAIRKGQVFGYLTEPQHTTPPSRTRVHHRHRRRAAE
jgi:hypothetical protein